MCSQQNGSNTERPERGWQIGWVERRSFFNRANWKRPAFESIGASTKELRHAHSVLTGEQQEKLESSPFWHLRI
jgi:hypothetical protein